MIYKTKISKTLLYFLKLKKPKNINTISTAFLTYNQCTSFKHFTSFNNDTPQTCLTFCCLLQLSAAGEPTGSQ